MIPVRSPFMTLMPALGAMALWFGASSVRADGPAPAYAEHQDLSYVLDADGRKQPIRTVEDWERRRQHVLAHMQVVMGPLPKPAMQVPLDVKVEEEERVGNVIRRKITYHTDSLERRIRAFLLVPADLKPGEKRPAVLCLHSTQPRGGAEPAGFGERITRQYAIQLAERGFVALSPDYPSFGDYAYEFDPKDGYISGTMKAIYDNIRGVDLLVSLPEVDADRIGTIGHSLGGHNAIFTAVFEPRIRAVVSSCGFTRFHKYYEGNLKGWTSNRYMPLISTRYENDPDRVPFDFTELIACLAPRPFFTNSPLKDGNFEVSGVRDVMEAAAPIYRLYGKPENLQADYPDYGHDFTDESREKAYRFLEQHLSRTK